MTHPRAQELIATLGLQPHPEGGFYREIHRSRDTVRPNDERPARAALTTIYFLLHGGQASRWHRVRSDEVWHLYEGGPLELLDLDLEQGTFERHTLAPVAGDARPVAVIAAGHWQAARSAGAYTLVGCTVAPGFDFADFHMMNDAPDAAREVKAKWPELAGLI